MAKWMTVAKGRFDFFLAGAMLLAAVLNIYGIWQDEYANSYYTSAVASMLQSFHNFFFASFDPGGYVTVDKPPVTFWVQTLSAAIFGLHGWSVILPQALAGVGSVLMIYLLVKPTFGRTAARIAAWVFACTPVAAAVSRTNNIDSLLVFTLLLAVWLLFRGIRRRSVLVVLGGFAVVGVGFNEKMLQAYMVVPAMALFLLLAWGGKARSKLAAMSGAMAVLLLVSLSWPVIVDLIPEDQRPYIGSSQTNSVLELAFGYNGVSRLTGNRGTGGGASMQDGGGARPDGASRWQDAAAPGAPQPGGSRGGGAFNTGEAGPLRLFQEALSGQASWLIPLAAFGVAGLLADARRRSWTAKHTETVFWLAWLLPVMAFFSMAGFFHEYYLIMLAPPVAALAGAGWAALWNAYRTKRGWTSWLLPAAVVVTAAFEWYIVHPYDDVIGAGWSAGIAVAGAAATSLLLVLKLQGRAKLARAAAAAGLIVLLIGPLYWAATPITYGQNSKLPKAEPSLSGGSGTGTQNTSYDADLIAYLQEHNTGEKWLFATTSWSTAAPVIIGTGEAVMAMGGYSGSDPITTTEELERLVADGEVKYFAISGGGFGGRGGGGSGLASWIEEHGTEIPAEEWKGQAADNSGSDARLSRDSDVTLYEVKS